MEKLQEAVRRLVLTRKVGESIDVGGIMRFTINRTRGNQVSILIEAPQDIAIKRSELAPHAKRTDAA